MCVCVCVKLEIKIYIKHPPLPPSNKRKGKSTTAAYTKPHIQTLNSQCGIRSCPPNRNNDFLPCFCINPSSMSGVLSTLYRKIYKMYLCLVGMVVLIIIPNHPANLKSNFMCRFGNPACMFPV